MKKIIDLLEKIQIAVAGTFLLIFLVTVVFQIACRYLGKSVTWTQDVAMYSFIWAVFMGGSCMVYEKKHFAFTSLSDMLKSDSVKSLLNLIIFALMLFFSVLMVKYGYLAMKTYWNYTWENIPSFKRGPTWLCIPLSGATSCIYLVYQIIDEIRNFGKGGER